ncbi:hypothetical protein PAXINDRAFT_18341 [Paxillus involutus ATCC 200175]|uniref:WD40 repeat-like protein n=1 Tax=Paxillus involutus ATCC 200175 TaxID=664439 RepID=A0A0C9TMN4_PAXIN|nr:hypothetical protein PAXINDRAFT_18341 [Paxillus involutus ATCC 200175]
MTSPTDSTASVLRRQRRVAPVRYGAARLDEGALGADIQASSRNAKEPKPSSQTPLKVLAGHTWGVTGLAFFPDGRRLISGSLDGLLIIWDVATGRVEKKRTGGTMRSVAVAPDGSVFASGSDDGTLRIWDGTTGNQIGGPLVTHAWGTQGIWGLAFSPDGRRITTTGNCTIQIWDVLTRASVAGPLRIPSGGVYTVAFSPDGSRIAADVGGRSVCVWNSVSGEVIFDSLKGHTDDVMWTVFMPNGQQLLTASEEAMICQCTRI